MPKRTARPRARRRALEGLDRINAILRSASPPWMADAKHCRQRAWEWSEIRDEVIPTIEDLEEHWTYQVIEVGVEVPPLEANVMELITVPLSDLERDEAYQQWRRSATERGRQMAQMVRAAWEQMQ